ncbi:hypothetical protein DSO57_1035771 [Entomophthora muscae]|uniref:Uncharacterized protein n=1 Tax=Entomophthora muscae TaxID=34485 RepID=A0ACC2SNM5_9FUNG|nr:hypothetical protein DSO57_1035771 [Entomophthora muscae]
MLLLKLLFTCLVQAEGPLKVMVSMGHGTNSHIKPLLEVGTMLRERNHTVFYSSLESYQKFNKPYQLPFVSLGKEKEVEGDMRTKTKQFFSRIEATSASKDMAQSFGKMAPGAYDVIYPAILKVMGKEKPDVVLCDFIATACRDAAQMLGIPLVTGFQATDFFGVTSSPFITTDLGYGSITTENMNFLQRFQSKVIDPLLDYYYYYPMVKNTNAVRAKYGVPPASTPFGDFSISLGLSSSFVGFEAAMNFPQTSKSMAQSSQSHIPLSLPSWQTFLTTIPRHSTLLLDPLFF